MSKLKHVANGDGSHYGYRFECPGCESPHVVPTAPSHNAWGFNASLDAPTFTPSILVHEVRVNADADPATVLAPFKPGDVFSPRCHSFVSDGRIQFLSDCGHALAGQTVDLPDVKETP